MKPAQTLIRRDHFDGEQVELNHRKFADLSITWNTIDPVGQATWPSGDGDDPDVHTSHLGWRHDTRPELAALEGRQLRAIELLEWTGSDVANGMVAVSFIFADDRLPHGGDCTPAGRRDPDCSRRQLRILLWKA